MLSNVTLSFKYVEGLAQTLPLDSQPRAETVRVEESIANANSTRLGVSIALIESPP